MSARTDRDEIALQRERCLLVGAVVRGRYAPQETPLDELACLVDTAGGEVAGRITQKMEHPHARTYLGKGKFEEMVELAVSTRADTVVVDDDLKPAQLGALEDACQRKVIDRSEVIMDIFCSRARTRQAQLQVELAQLQYQLPRLVRKWTHLERLGGGIGTRGPGESQIESDRRIIRGKIQALEEELEKIGARRVREVAARKACFTVSLVGYTNAGKSTLMNRLTGAGAFVEDRLFATLDTLTRKLQLANGAELLVSDTVGFIRRLPHHLVASFHATLEEAAGADLLLHVVDGADPLAAEYAASVNDTLSALGMEGRDMAYVINKVDAVTDPASLHALAEALRPSLQLSAVTGAGAGELLEMLGRKAMAGKLESTLRFSSGDGKRLAVVNQLGKVLETSYDGADVIVRAVLEAADLERIRKLPGEMLVE